MIKCKMYSIYTEDEDNYSTPNIPGVEWVKNDDEAQLLVFENFKIPEVEKIISTPLIKILQDQADLLHQIIGILLKQCTSRIKQ